MISSIGLVAGYFAEMIGAATAEKLVKIERFYSLPSRNGEFGSCTQFTIHVTSLRWTIARKPRFGAV